MKGKVPTSKPSKLLGSNSQAATAAYNTEQGLSQPGCKMTKTADNYHHEGMTAVISGGNNNYSNYETNPVGESGGGGNLNNNPTKQQLDKPLTIIGADAVNLYPSLEKNSSARTCKKAMFQTEIKIRNVNHQAAAMYLAMEMTPAEIYLSGLKTIIPRRRFKKGTRPSTIGPVAMGPNSDDESQWIFPDVEPTDAQSKLLIATVIQVAVKTVFETHVYQFDGKLYHQQQGGPIGLRATGAIAKVIMNDWDCQLMKCLVENDLRVEAAARYVDDVRLWIHQIERGWRWEGRQLVYKEEWMKEEENENTTDTAKTASVIKAMMNDITKCLKFTTETHEDFSTGTLPTLDSQLWMSEGRVMYKFYEKPMANKKVISRRSAMGENSKQASLSQEVVRRMKNTLEDICQEEKNSILNEFVVKLISSEYSVDQARRIIIAGLRGYERLLKKQQDGIQDIHRPAAQGLGERNRKKLLAKTKWFKDKAKKESSNQKPQPQHKPSQKRKGRSTHKQPTTSAAEIKTTTILFVQHTPGGQLARELREAEKELSAITGFRVKIVERNGTAAKQLLQKNTRWAEGDCGRMSCIPCQTGEVKDCSRRSIVYTNRCRTCKNEGKDHLYIGESARSAQERGGEHLRDFNRKTEDSHMWKHCSSEHPNQKDPDFEFRILSNHRSALNRQVTEAVMVRRAGTAVLNSKGIYNRCKLPRLTVEGHNKTEIEPGGEDGNTTTSNIEWTKFRSKRQTKKQMDRPSKRQKMDPNPGPRTDGIMKRKQPTLQEFNRECKKFRPSFDPELECGNETPKFDMASHPENKIVLIPLKSKPKAKATINILVGKPATFRPTQPKPKPKQKRKVKVKPSYPAEVNKENTILNYFKPSASPAETEPNLDGGQDQSSTSSSPLKGDSVAQSAVQS